MEGTNASKLGRSNTPRIRVPDPGGYEGKKIAEAAQDDPLGAAQFGHSLADDRKCVETVS